MAAAFALKSAPILLGQSSASVTLLEGPVKVWLLPVGQNMTLQRTDLCCQLSRVQCIQ
jgi:hypothetical protein